MAKVTQHKCPKCGAPLVLQKGVSDVACQYCRTVVHVEWGKKPPGGQQQLDGQQQLVIYAKNPLPAVVIVLIVLGLLVPIGGTVLMLFGTVAVGMFTAFQAADGIQAAAGLTPSTSVAKSFPVTCGMNQEVLISAQKFEGPGPLVTGEVNCKIRIKDSTLKATDGVVVLAKNMAEVTVENSTLEGKEAAVKLAVNSKLFAKKKSAFRGPELAIFAGINSEIGLDETSVEGGETGIQADSAFNLTGTKSTISGKDYGIRGTGGTLSVVGKELVMKGGRAALETPYNLKLDLRGGLAEGGEVGVRLKQSNAEIKLSRGAEVRGKEVGIKADVNLQLDMEDASVVGGDIAVEAGGNPKLTLGPKSRIHGKSLALKLGVNTKLDLRDASIESEGTAICAAFNVEIQARNSKIKGGTEAFRFEEKPDQLELAQTSVTGKQTFNAKGCGAR
ncbi:MAG TPA: hypothetical protein VGK73_19300 [Polyangiaceae bacterium]